MPVAVVDLSLRESLLDGRMLEAHTKKLAVGIAGRIASQRGAYGVPGSDKPTQERPLYKL